MYNNIKVGKAWLGAKRESLSKPRVSFDTLMPKLYPINQGKHCSVESIGYDAPRQQLYVKYKNSSDIIIFHHVCKREYHVILSGKSISSHINKSFKIKHPSSKL